MIRLSHYFKAIYKMGFTQEKMGICFGGFDKASVNEWINNKKRTSMSPEAIYLGTEECRKTIGLDKQEFINRLIDNLDSNQITFNEKKGLLDKFGLFSDYKRFLLSLIQDAYQNSYGASKPSLLVYDPQNTNRKVVGLGIEHIIAVKKDGSMLSTGADDYQQCRVHTWRNIVAVACGYRKTIGLSSDGTCQEIGLNPSPNNELFRWKNIVAIEAGPFHTLALNASGRVFACGYSQYGQCALDEWRDIVSIAAGTNHSVGLKSDGTVVAKGSNQYGQCDLSSWKQIVQIAAAGDHTVGLTKDHRVLIAGDITELVALNELQLDGVISIATGLFHIIGLKPDRTVVAAGFQSDKQCDVTDWQDVIAIFAGYNTSAAVRNDGRVLATHRRALNTGHTDTSRWQLFDAKGNITNETIDIRLSELKDLMQQAQRLTLDYIYACQKNQMQMLMGEAVDDYEANELLEKMTDNVLAMLVFKDKPGISPLFSELITNCASAFQQYRDSVEPGVGKLYKSMGQYLTLADNELLMNYLTGVRMTIQQINQRL